MPKHRNLSTKVRQIFVNKKEAIIVLKSLAMTEKMRKLPR